MDPLSLAALSALVVFSVAADLSSVDKMARLPFPECSEKIQHYQTEHEKHRSGS